MLVVVLAMVCLARGHLPVMSESLHIQSRVCQQNGCVWTGQPGQCNKEVPSGVLSTSEQLSEVVMSTGIFSCGPPRECFGETISS